MDVKPGYVLRADQRADPVLWRHAVELQAPLGDSARYQTMLESVFGSGRSKRLQTWDRAPEDPNGPHWIGVRSGTPLHTDPRYPRFTHQLIVRNDGWALSGITREVPAPFPVGTLFCCDTHSPHVLLRDQSLGDGLFYLAASIDSIKPLPIDEVLAPLLRFLESYG